MKNKLFTLLFSCMAFLSGQPANAGLIGKEVNFIVIYNTGSFSRVRTEQTLTIQSPYTSNFGITVDDTSIKIAPRDNSEIPSTVQGAFYGIELVNDPLPELDWMKFAETYPNFNLSENLILQVPIEIPNGFFLYIDNRSSFSSDFAYYISILGANDGTVAVPEPPIIGALLIGLLALIRSRRQTQSSKAS